MRIALIILLISLEANAATWYLDSNATGVNNGTSWPNAWTNFYVVVRTNFIAGDTLEVAGGQYLANSNHDFALLPACGTNNSPFTLKHSRTAGKNGMAHVTIPMGVFPNTVIDGAITDNCETNFTATPSVAFVNTNCGFWFDGRDSTNIDVMTIVGYPDPAPPGYDRQHLYSLNIKWSIFAGQQGNYQSIKFLDCIKAPDLLDNAGFNLGYCEISNIIEAAVSLSATNQAFGNLSIHHVNFPYQQDLSMGAIYAGSGWGLDLHHCVLNKYPLNLGGENETATMTFYWRVWNNIIYPCGDATLQTFVDSGTNYHHCYFYGNLVIPNPTNFGLFFYLGRTSVQMSSEPTNPQQCFTNLYVNDWRFFNNTAVSVLNGPSGIVQFLAKGWLLSPNGSCPANATNANLCNFQVQPSGVMMFNNLSWSDDPANHSLYALYPDYSAFNGTPNTKCANGLCGVGHYNGWSYDTNGVLFDYNIGSGLSYSSNNTLQIFTMDNFKTFSGYAHNRTNMPPFKDRFAEDYRPLSGVTGGMNLSSFATNMPDLGTDLYGRSRGQVNTDGTWSIGALETYNVVNTVTNGLVCHLTFADDFTSTNRILDFSGHNTDVIQFGLPGTNMWPSRIADGPPGFNYSVNFITNLLATLSYGDFVGYHYVRYGAITNVAPIDGITSMTIALWAKHAAYPSYVDHPQATFLDTGWFTSGNWVFGRDGNVSENTCFMIRTNGIECCGPRVVFPDATPSGGTPWNHYTIVVDLTNHVMNAWFNGTNFMSTPLGTNITALHCVQQFSSCIAFGVQTHDGTPRIDKWPDGTYVYLDMSGDDYPNDAWFTGEMTDVRIYNRALTGTEVLTLFNGSAGGGPGPTPPPPPPPTTIARVTNLHVNKSIK